MAVFTRILLLLSLRWIISLDEPFATLPLVNIGISGHDVILIAGGLFLLWKSTHEIHQKLEGIEGESSARVVGSFWSVIVQIMLLDIVFSLDSVITAVGMVDEIAIMIAAVIIAAGVMVFTSGPISRFVEEHPTIKMLALSFLLMIGFTLIVEGFHQHIPKGYIYFAMAFSIGVELLNLRLRKRAVQPVNLREAYAIIESNDSVPVEVKKIIKKTVNKPKSKGKKR
jgi:predicted tellurium resistance membrane protein TerC